MGTQVRDRGVVSSFIGSRQIDFFNGRTFRIQIRSPLHPLTLEGRRRTEDEVDGREDRARGQHSRRPRSIQGQVFGGDSCPLHLC